MPVIQGNHEDELPLQKAGFNVVWTDNVDPYKKRKVRILNGAHTSMVLAARLYGLETVGECLKDEKVSALLKNCKQHFSSSSPLWSMSSQERTIKPGSPSWKRL